MPLTAPDPLTVVSVTDTAAALQCASVADATGYEFEYRQTGASSWLLFEDSATPSASAGAVLLPSTSYEFRARAKKLSAGNPVTVGLLAEYKFLEGSGQQALDSSGNGYNARLGTTTGPEADDPIWIAGGGIDSAPNKIMLPDISFYSGSPSFTAFAVSTLSPSDSTVRRFYGQGSPSTGASLSMGTAGDGRLFVSFYASEAFSSAALSTAQGLVCITHDAATLTSQFYQNNAAVGGGVHGLTPAVVNAGGRIFRHTVFDFANHWGQQVHYMAFYDRVLTPLERAAVTDYIRSLVASRGVILP